MLNRSLARLSSGSKLINPSDDAAGAAVSARLDAQVNRTQAASDNVGNAVSFSQTQDGYLKKVAKALDRMSELSMLALDETKSDTDRGLYNTEFQNLGTFITKTAERDFNGVSMFGGASLGVSISSEADTFSYTGVNLSSGASYTAATGASITTTGNATTALGKVKDAITQLAEQLGVSQDNLIAANSRIKDVNVADESTSFARFNILVQAGTAMLAQANSTPQSALRLLG
jgi:flagellin